MKETHVPIGQVKRDISELVNRVAYSGERIVLTSRGKPKAVIVSLEDYEHLEKDRVNQAMARWQAWRAANDQLGNDILERRHGVPLDVDSLWQAARADLEDRDAQIPGC